MRFITKLVVVATIFMGGCASYSYTDAPGTYGGWFSKYVDIGYEGDLQPIGDVGVVTTDGVIRVYGLNGLSMSKYRNFKKNGFSWGGRYQLHLVPGTHTLDLGFHYDIGTGVKKWSTTTITKTVTLTKGQVLHLSWVDHGRTWSVQEHDGSKALEVIAEDFLALTNKR